MPKRAFLRSIKAAALQADFRGHYVDHLGAITTLMEIPLLFTDKEQYELAQQFYPSLNAELISWRELAPDTLAKKYDVLFYSSFCYQSTFRELLQTYEKQFEKKIRTVCCPHGNSDKGHSSNYLQWFANEDITLIYGQQMLDFLRSKEVVLKNPILTGNYRYLLYQSQKAFYDDFFQQEVLLRFADPSKKLILYAPTWDDGENGSALFEFIPFLLDDIPSDYNVIVKCHPLLEELDLIALTRLLYAYENHPNIVILHRYPAIYPLLAHTDILIGEVSSVGYDFLTFNRPLFFLQPKQLPKNLPLYQCGRILHPTDYPSLYPIIEQQLLTDEFMQKRKELYAYTFGKEKPLSLLRHEIEESCTSTICAF